MQEQGQRSGSRNFGRGQHVSNRGRSMNSGLVQSKNFNKQQNQETSGYPEENLQLVPCRWSHTGWKYVQCDPAKTQFFSSPNRVNSFGFKKDGNGGRKRYDMSMGAVAGRDYHPGESEFQTSYGRFFNPGNQGELSGWKQKFNNADYGVSKSGKNKTKDEQLIQWAGGLHQRGDFNKRRDNLGQWTEVLFHH